MSEPTADAAKKLVDLLMQESDEIKMLVLPALREVLAQVRDVRMALSNEVVQILNSLGTLKKTVEYSKDMNELAASIRHLALTVENIAPGTKIKLQDLFHTKG